MQNYKSKLKNLICRKGAFFIRAALVFGVIGILAAPLFPSQAAIIRSLTDTLSDLKISQSSNHTVFFQTLTGVDATSDTITVSFEIGFNVSGLDYGDVDFSHGPTTGTETEETLAAVAAAGTWGASFSGQTLTLSAPTDAGGSEVAASDFVVIEIGTNATTGSQGDTPIANPSSTGSYRVFIGGTFGDEGRAAVSIVSDSQVAVSATITTGAAEGGGGGPPPPPPPPPPPDVTPPTISNIVVTDITQTSVRIIWTTNEAANSRIEYGPTASYGGSAGDLGTYVYNHNVVLGALAPGTLYHFRVLSSDPSGNQGSSGDNTFTTSSGVDITPPIISNIAVIDITGLRATVTWNTDEPATSAVEYGITLAYGTVVSDTSLVTNHSVTIIGLSSETLYHFRVRSEDASVNENVSDDGAFTTLDITPPVISNIAVSDITETSARITWDTDEPATSQVEYGTSAAYGSSVNNDSLVTSHSLSLVGLTGGILYHFRIGGSDANGNAALSSDQTFRTAPDLTPPPNVNNFQVISTTDTSITLAWDPPASSDYRGVKIRMSTSDYPANIFAGVGVYDGNGTSLTVGGLAPGTTYYFTAFAYDAVRNYASGALATGTTLTAPPLPPPPEEVPPPEGVTPPPPEEVPPVGVPPITVPPEEKVTIDILHLLVSGRKLELPVVDETVRGLRGLAITVSVSADSFRKEISRIILNVGASSYLLERNLAGDAFEAGFILPNESARLTAALIINYEDGASDSVSFVFLIEDYGTVYEISRGVRTPVPGAEVILYSHDGEVTTWEATFYNQLNPLVVGADGSFAFLVPSGNYHLEAAKAGYRRGESPVFEISDIIVNREIEIFRIPPSFSEVIKPGAPLAENIIAVARNIGEKTVFARKVAEQEVKKVVDNVKVEKVNEVVAAPAIVTVALVNVTAAVSLTQILAYLQFLFTQPFLLLEKKKRKGWGVVYNALSKLPIDLAIVRLVDTKTGKPVATRVTDKEGRYAFIVSIGAYKIEVTKSGFIFPTSVLKSEKEDVGFAEIYHGEDVAVGETNATITANIPLDPLEAPALPRQLIIRKYLRKLNHLIAVSGIILSLFSFVITPKPLFAFFVVLQIAMYLLFRKLSKIGKPKSWGIVYDEATQHPLRFAIARIFETKYNKLLETQVTDGRGRYSFLVGRNKYYVTYEKNGYEKKQTEEIDFAASEKPEIVAKDVGLKKL